MNVDVVDLLPIVMSVLKGNEKPMIKPYNNKITVITKLNRCFSPEVLHRRYT